MAKKDSTPTDLHALADEAPAIREALEPVVRDGLNPLLEQLRTVLASYTAAIEKTELLTLLKERESAFEDILEIIAAPTMPVEEEICPRCEHPRGEPHGRTTCATQARLDAISERLSKGATE